MPTKVECPKCHKVVDTRFGSYPLCPECNEYLTKCRYCRHLDNQTSECTHPRIVSFLVERNITNRTIQDLDAYIECDLHATTIGYDARRRLLRRLMPVLRVSGVVALLVAVAWFMFRPVTKEEETPPPSALTLELVCPTQVELEQPFNVAILVRNREEQDSRPIRIRISERIFEWFSLDHISPPPRDMTILGAGRYISYPPLPGKSEMMIRLYLEPTQLGEYLLDVTLDAPGSMVHRYREEHIDVI